jgi:mannose/fructose-specific phosphotransferase system component IIA
MTTHEALAEAAAEFLSPIFPDVDDVTFAAFVDEVVDDLEQRFADAAATPRA